MNAFVLNAWEAPSVAPGTVLGTMLLRRTLSEVQMVTPTLVEMLAAGNVGMRDRYATIFTNPIVMGTVAMVLATGGPPACSGIATRLEVVEPGLLAALQTYWRVAPAVIAAEVGIPTDVGLYGQMRRQLEGGML